MDVGVVSEERSARQQVVKRATAPTTETNVLWYNKWGCLAGLLNISPRRCTTIFAMNTTPHRTAPPGVAAHRPPGRPRNFPDRRPGRERRRRQPATRSRERRPATAAPPHGGHGVRSAATTDRHRHRRRRRQRQHHRLPVELPAEPRGSTDNGDKLTGRNRTPRRQRRCFPPPPPPPWPPLSPSRILVSPPRAVKRRAEREAQLALYVVALV